MIFRNLKKEGSLNIQRTTFLDFELLDEEEIKMPELKHITHLQDTLRQNSFAFNLSCLDLGVGVDTDKNLEDDICHANQLLRKGGLKDENIIVFMYYDIAYSEESPRPGVIINSSAGEDVYEGVPKHDYTRDDVNVDNFLAVLLSNKTALTRCRQGGE
ncbi:hypothetical protein KY290_001149 [Solanum tuberosum]|uniref:Uncharacterized protein n=1 Tax=Solanum tuberosum TaxID=4113 RepID=A0ABQ7WLA8_SOLTU|nr:hypothetical protein KY290_001149 [Solanum tuberosum]